MLDDIFDYIFSTWLIINIIVFVILTILTIPIIVQEINKNNYEVEDVNRDGVVDIEDLLQVQKYILEKSDNNEE